MSSDTSRTELDYPNARVAIAGCGPRALRYARWIESSTTATLAGVAEPNVERRNKLLAITPSSNAWAVDDWRDLISRKDSFDIVIICLPDRLRNEPVVALLDAGVNMLLEKPIAPTIGELRQLTSYAARSKSTVSVAHTLRYTPYTLRIKELLDSGAIGNVRLIQHTEPLSFFHFAHSYVRGPWSSVAKSAPMILTKTSHDFDLIGYWGGAPIRTVSSIGGQYEFIPANKPTGAADRCQLCQYRTTCSFSATRLYQNLADEEIASWALDPLASEASPSAVREWLSTTKYGECVWNGNNDAADNQLCSMTLTNGVIAQLAVTGLGVDHRRHTRIYGSEGELEGDVDTIRVSRFDGLTATEAARFEMGSTAVEKIEVEGDVTTNGLMDALVRRVRGETSGHLVTTLEDSLNSHYAAFAAERSRANHGAPATVDPGVGAGSGSSALGRSL